MNEIFAYEKIPYLSKFFIYTHPEHLAVLAKLFGLQSPNIEKSRVLELGCGNGSNLIAHAFSLPNSEFIGVDLSKKHIEQGNQFIQDLNLKNIKLYQLDLMDMTSERFGEFDYIIAHGLLSWVPDFVREKVLQIYQEMLAPNGVGYISYNVYPGTFLREIAQKPMKFFTEKISDPIEKVNQAVSFLNFLSDEIVETDIFQPILKAGLEHISQKELADIFHDDLSEINHPFYFHEFAENLNQHNLQYLAETDIPSMSAQSFSAQARSFIESQNTIVEREQYIDFFRGRFFRRSLICHKNVQLNRQLNPAILDNFLISAYLNPVSENPNLLTWQAEKFIGFKDVGFEVDHPLTKMALFILGKLWAKAIPFTQLLENAKTELEKQGITSENWENEFKITHQIIMQIYLNTEFISLHLYQPPAKTDIPEKPKINELARWQLSVGDNVYALLNQSFNASDPMLRHLLELMDGTRNTENLIENLLEFSKTQKNIETREEIAEKLKIYLTLMARMGMFK